MNESSSNVITSAIAALQAKEGAVTRNQSNGKANTGAVEGRPEAIQNEMSMSGSFESSHRLSSGKKRAAQIAKRSRNGSFDVSKLKLKGKSSRPSTLFA